MKGDKLGVDLIATFEGFSSKPYYATAEEKTKNIVTIGYGNTFYPNGKKVQITDKPISKELAASYLEFTIIDFSKKLKITSNVNQNQFNALVSLAYNIGVTAFNNSTLLKLVNINPKDGNIAIQFLKWNKQGGKVLDGLTKRRIKESSLYFTI